jgi:hypothetical protein
LSVDHKDEDRLSGEDELPRQGILATLPKRTLSRVVILLAALAGIVYLRQRTSLIAGCMANAFLVSPTAEPMRSSVSLKARVLMSPDAQERGR